MFDYKRKTLCLNEIERIARDTLDPAFLELHEHAKKCRETVDKRVNN